MKLLRNMRFWFEPWDYDDFGRKRLGSWSQSYTGERYWIMDPRPDEVHLTDIAVGLSNAARYRGQTRFFYPVSTHSVLVSQSVERIALERGWAKSKATEAARQGLLHDASEAYLGDVARPLKRMRAMREYCRVEKLWEDAIFERFNIKPTKASNELVHEVDHRIVLDEIYTFMADPDMWPDSGRYLDVEPLDINVPNLTREQSMDMFYRRYNELEASQ